MRQGEKEFLLVILRLLATLGRFCVEVHYGTVFGRNFDPLSQRDLVITTAINESIASPTVQFSPTTTQSRAQPLKYPGCQRLSNAVSGFCQLFIVTRASPLVAPKILATREKNLWYPGYLLRAKMGKCKTRFQTKTAQKPYPSGRHIPKRLT